MTAWAEDWELARQDKQRNIQVYTRAQENSPYNEFHAQTVVSQPINTVVAVLADINAWPQWVARIKEVSVLKKQDGQSWVYVVYKLPYPFVERDTVLYARLAKNPQTSEVTINGYALSGYSIPKKSPVKRVRLNNISSTWRLTPLASGGTKIELSGRGEPGGYMPSLIFNYNLPDEPQQTLRLLRKMLLRPQYAAEKLANKKEQENKK
jgi:ribosome-associated toxin RatA of RatAB toxin-antitoxin module